MQARRDRALRAVLSAAVSTLLTAAAHAAAGGALPHPLLLALVLAAGTLVCLALGGARLRLVTLVPAVAVVQGLLHLAFSTAGGAAPAGTPLTPGVHRHAALVLPGVVEAHGAHGSMLGAHVLSGLVTVVALRLAAGSLRRAVGALALQVGGPVRQVLARLLVLLARDVASARPVVGAGVPVRRPVRRPVSLRLATSRVLRGPPAGASLP